MDEMNIVNWAAESGKHHEARGDDETAPEIPQYCRNCGYEVPKLYCTYCGQSVKNVRVSLHSLVMDFLGDYFTFDSKLFRSIVPLFFKPGFLTAAFMEGKRVRFIPPLRLYIFSSIIFFLSLSAVTNPRSWFKDESEKKQDTNVIAPIKVSDADKREEEANEPKTDPENQEKNVSDDAVDGANQKKTAEPEVEGEVVKPAEPPNADVNSSKPRKSGSFTVDLENDSKSKDKKSKKRNNINLMNSGFDENTWWGRWLNKRIKAQEEKLEAMDQQDLVTAFVTISIKNVPKALFLLMPLFAFFLKLLYVRRDPLYIDHLIFAFHFHAFLFLFYSVLIWMGMAFTSLPGWSFALAVFFIPPVYLFFDLRCVYRQGWIKTFIKFNLLSFLYFFSLNFNVALVSIVSLFMI